MDPLKSDICGEGITAEDDDIEEAADEFFLRGVLKLWNEFVE